MLKKLIIICLCVILQMGAAGLRSEDGYRLWLRYDLVRDPAVLEKYRSLISGYIIQGESATLSAASKELETGLNGLLGESIPAAGAIKRNGVIVAGTPWTSDLISSLNLQSMLAEAGDEGYLILSTRLKRKTVFVIAGNSDIGVLYGVFHFLRLLQTHSDISTLSLVRSPKAKYRMLNHWDNLNRSVERGYSGLSLWDWRTLPDSIDPRYIDYARANASIGINATSVTNVNANALVLTKDYLVKVAALANVFRPYGIKVFLTARFSAPVETGKLKTADPLDPEVIRWWNEKAGEISPLMPEFQITQEYLGSSVHLVFLAPLFEECLRSDTYSKGKGSTVARVSDGTLDNHQLTAMAGVSNIGSSRNWTGHLFGQANWYAFGRLAWDPDLTSSGIADEWIRMTLTNTPSVLETVKKMMLESREIAVNYMTPSGLHHIMYSGHHYGPGPWVSRGRQDWTSVYYHKADEKGIGFNRSSSGSNAVSQYFPEVRDLYTNPGTCPENLLLWFHHVSWDYKMKSGRTVWEEICYKYNTGVDSVKWLQKEWSGIKDHIDSERYQHVSSLLHKQERDAKIWRNGCLLYFQTFSKRPFPEYMEKPLNDLNYYINHRYTDIPGITPGL